MLKDDTNLHPDGHHAYVAINYDTWVIRLPSEYNGLITIYDRYGKLIKQISSYGAGWDGTFNGITLPSSDYWFKVEYTENNTRKEFKSHFSLKR